MIQSDELFERLSLDETLRRVFLVYRSSFGVFTKISAVVGSTIIFLWTFIILPLLLLVLKLSDDDVKDKATLLENNPAAYFILLGAIMVLAEVICLIAYGSIAKAVADLYTNRQPDWQQCMRVGMNKAPTLMLAAFLRSLGLFVGFTLFVVPGVYLSVAWFVYAPAIVLENLSSHRGLRRSYNLVSGEWCYAFCSSLIISCIVGVTYYPLAHDALVTFWGEEILRLGVLGSFTQTGSILSMVPLLIGLPLFVITQAVMYINLRVQTDEVLNAEILLHGMGETPSTAGDDETMDVYHPITLEEDDEVEE